MYSPSFTFSSNGKSISAIRMALATMAITLILLGILNYHINWMLRPYQTETKMGRVLRYLKAIQAQQPAPTVLFMGSSRFQSAIIPSIFDAFFNMDGIRFLNCSQPSMTFWEYSKILEQVDMGALDVRVCIVEVDPWTFSKYSRHPLTKTIQEYRRGFESWGSLSEILGLEGLSVKGKLLFQKYLPRRSFSDLFITASSWMKGTTVDDASLPGPRYQIDANAEAKQRANPTFYARNISQCHMYNYTFNETKANQFVRFIDDLQRQGITVVVVQPPVVAAYYDYVKSDSGRMSEFQKHLHFMDMINSRYSLVNWPLSEDAGLTDSIFIDYGHFTLAGAYIFSQVLAKNVKKDIEKALKPESLQSQVNGSAPKM